MASLLGEPFWLSIDQIKGLTDRQICELYFHPRDDHGRIQTEGRADREMTPAEEDAMVLAMGRRMGITEDRLKQVIEKAKAKRGVSQ